MSRVMFWDNAPTSQFTPLIVCAFVFSASALWNNILTTWEKKPPLPQLWPKSPRKLAGLISLASPSCEEILVPATVYQSPLSLSNNPAKSKLSRPPFLQPVPQSWISHMWFHVGNVSTKFRTVQSKKNFWSLRFIRPCRLIAPFGRGASWVRTSFRAQVPGRLRVEVRLTSKAAKPFRLSTCHLVER